MLLNLFNKKDKQFLALDIGSQNTKMMLFQKGKAFVDKMIIKPTPADSYQMGSITNESNLSEFLVQTVAELEIESEVDVIAGISGKGVIAKKIDINIPQMEEAMIPEFVAIEAEQELFYNKEEMELDYEVLEGVNFDKPETQSLLVVTVLKKVIENYNTIIEKSDMDCKILDTNFTALFNSFEYNAGIDKSNIYMVLDIGCLATNLIILVNNQVVFARNLPFGGNFFNQGIVKKMGIDNQEAEELKISASRGEDAPQELSSLISNELNEIFTEELFSCYELYLSLFPKKEVAQVYVTGGASQTLDLVSRLQKKLNVPVNDFNPFQNVKLSSDLQSREEEFKKYSAVVTGLALRSLHDKS